MSQKFRTILILIFPLLPNSFSKTQPISSNSTYSNEFILFLENLVKQFSGCELVYVEDLAKTSPTHFGESNNFHNLFSLSSGSHHATLGANISYSRHSDVHRFAQEHCGVAILSISQFNSERESWLVDTLIPRYGPVLRKDQDHFLFLTPSDASSNDILNSPKFGSKIKYKLSVFPRFNGRSSLTIVCKTVDLYGNGGQGQLQILKEISTFPVTSQDSSNLFPDMTRTFNGKVFRFAIPKVAFRFEIEKRSDGRYHPKRGFYKWWLDEAMRKFNFTYEMFYASFGGGTGKLLKNGTWVGATGDLFYGKADCSFIVGEIYSRHKFLGWSAPISYEWVIFITHPPRNSYSAKAIFKPFTVLMWILFFASVALMTFCLKNVAHAGFDPNGGVIDWGYFRMMSYVFSTLIEQDKEGPFRSHSVRVLCAFWLLFAMITTTVYRGKLVSLIAFPINTWVPETFEELANSNFKVALNVVGKAGAAYVLIATSTSPVFQTLSAKMELVPDAEVCLQRAMDEDLACIIWKGIADYAMVKNLTDRNGHVPLQESSQIALFIGDGLVYERRAIFGQHLDRTIQAVVQMGLTIKWFQLDQEFIIKERKIYEQSRKIKQKVYDFDDGPKKLVVSQFTGLFLLSLVGILIGCAMFGGEVYWHKRGGRVIQAGIEKAVGKETVDDSDSATIPFQAAEVRQELYELGLLAKSNWTYT